MRCGLAIYAALTWAAVDAVLALAFVPWPIALKLRGVVW